ncbi:hypothetical protein LSH36_54g09009 [Paralvinella palmiformis]|uniref:Trafficking protein particle complex subunit 9 n=1 Tax=Paralvinella palmiformis TaxID=53620 RepID=A0AAD9K5Q2_9ANNE|nr:hypothetical protein LSH36_54g09009 [Paralvinella palmiformis]
MKIKTLKLTTTLHFAISFLQKHLAAADFLQNIVYINLQLTDAEKAGMRRKGALFKRLAGMQCVTNSNPKPAWQKCYYLLLEALDGYKLTLDAKDRPKGYTYGWPLVQMRVLHEMIYSARKMGNPAIAIRHLCYLLHAMFPYLQRSERQELASVLESYTIRCEAPAQCLTLENGTVLPPVPFLHFPLVKSFKFSEPAPHLRPVRLKSVESLIDSDMSGGNLFIYSPLQQRNKSKTKSEIICVQDDSCDCLLQLYNPLPFELKITYLNVLTEGCQCEFLPQSLSLPAEYGPYQVKVSGRIQQSGRLIITEGDEIVVKVTPPLPTLQLSTTLPKDASFSSQENSDSVLIKKLCECSLQMVNISNLDVENMILTMEARQNIDLLRNVIVWNDANMTSQLPLQANSQASLTLYINTSSDLLSLPELSYSTDSMIRSKQSTQDFDDSSSSKVFECLLKLQYSGGQGLTEEYCRQCAVAMTIEIQPSVIVKSWNVLPSQSAFHCHLILELENVTAHTMEILTGDTCVLSIGSGQCKRCAVQIARYETNLDNSPSCGGDNLQSSYTDTSPSCDVYEQQALMDHPSEDKEGHLSLGKLSFTPDQIALLQVSALKWDLSLKDNKAGSVCNHPVCGEICTVSWTLCNQSDHQYHDLRVTLCITQHHLKGIQYMEVLSTQVVVMGTSSTCFNILPPGGFGSHQCSVIFLQPGIYNIRVTCQAHYRDGSNLNPPQKDGKIPDDPVTYHSPTLSVTVTDPSIIPSEADR